ncbi:MAG TPA: methyltransferase [Segetibacter sp.]|nr:methyltransferase [Segetibacter sp.]
MQTTTQPTPSNIMQVGLGFWASKVLLTAVNAGLFTHLAKKPLSLKEIKALLRWNCMNRHASDFLDTLFALGFLKREGIGESAIYSNTDDTDFFLDKEKPGYIGGILEMANNRLFRFWANLDDAMKTGKLQNEAANKGDNLFEAIYSSPEKTREFVNAMTGIQVSNFIEFANKFDFSKYKTLCDIGGAGAMLSIQVALHNPHIACNSFDLPPVKPVALENITHYHLGDRIKTTDGDFFNDAFPKADIITMGNILHDWSEERKQILIKKAYDALPEGGAFVAIENVIDNQRAQNVFGLTMSLNMLIETEEGFDYTLSDFENWTKQAGFKTVEQIPLAGPSSAAIAYK